MYFLTVLALDNHPYQNILYIYLLITSTLMKEPIAISFMKMDEW